jgi:hypothetical protein
LFPGLLALTRFPIAELPTMENVNGCVTCVRFRYAGTVWASTFLEDAQTSDTCHYLQGAQNGLVCQEPPGFAFLSLLLFAEEITLATSKSSSDCLPW